MIGALVRKMLRVGRTLGVTLYDEPESDWDRGERDDRNYIGAVQTREQAAEIVEAVNTMRVHDGHHSMIELYEHRYALWIALANMCIGSGQVWRSWAHSDGGGYPGWFLLGIGKAAGRQMTYHLPERLWDRCDFAETLDCAPEFDGHTAADVLRRLEDL